MGPDSEPSAILEAQLDYLERNCNGMIMPSVQCASRSAAGVPCAALGAFCVRALWRMAAACLGAFAARGRGRALAAGLLCRRRADASQRWCACRLDNRKGRRGGGQGAVAFARRVEDANREFAIKFFFSDSAFSRESSIANIPVRAFLASHSGRSRAAP